MVSPRETLVSALVAIGLAANAAVLWAILVPMPATRFGVSPEGVTIDYGLRSESWPWSRAFVRGRRLEVLSARFGFSSRFSLTPFQSHRAELLRPRDR